MKNIVYSYTNDYLIRPTEFMNETFSKMYSEGLEAIKLKRPTKDGRIYKKLSKNIILHEGNIRSGEIKMFPNNTLLVGNINKSSRANNPLYSVLLLQFLIIY